MVNKHYFSKETSVLSVLYLITNPNTSIRNGQNNLFDFCGERKFEYLIRSRSPCILKAKFLYRLASDPN